MIPSAGNLSPDGYKIDELTVIDARPEYCRMHLDVMNTVSFEGKYLTTSNGFTYEEMVSFYEFCEREGFPQFYVLDENGKNVGWCDIVAREGQKRTAGYIGLGLLPEYRDRGVGRRLMLYAMKRARDCGFTEIRLDCRLTNKRAIHLYRKLGFRTTGIRPHGLYVNGHFCAVICMKLKLKSYDFECV